MKYIVQRNTQTFQFFTFVGRMSQPATAIEGLRGALPTVLANKALTSLPKPMPPVQHWGERASRGLKAAWSLFSPLVNERCSWQGTQRSMTRPNMNIKEITHG